MKRLLLAMLLAGSAWIIGSALADEVRNPGSASLTQATQPPAPKKSGEAPPPAPKKSGEPRLGVAVEPVPPVVRSQVSGLAQGQGLLIVHVSKDSPAAKAGLKPFDILTAYGDQKLSSPEQLVNLVHQAKVGQEVSFSYLRGGKTETGKATLDERGPMPFPPPVQRSFSEDELRRLSKDFIRPDDASAWESFDAMKLSRIDGKRWHAEIEFRAKDGKKERKVFEGTREEIRKDIDAQKDLPANERRHLLRALNLQPQGFEFPSPFSGTREQ